MSMKNSPIGMKTILMIVLVLTFLIPINVFAELPFYVALKPGIYSPQSSDLDSSGFNGEIAFGYRFNPNIAAEFGIGYFNTEAEATAVGATYVVREKVDIDVVPLTLTLKAILPYKRWEFFGLVGAGVYFVSGPYDYYYYYNYYYYDYDDDDYDVVLGGYLGGGVHYNITPAIFVGVEGKYLWTDKATLKDEAYGIPLEAKFKMDGIIATAVFGIKF
jgi:opacity protein-like surface antigen